MTADGKIATGNRKLSSFSSPRDKTHMFELRAKADAVMSGARTVDLNAVTMGPGPRRFRRLRLRHGLSAYNLRVIASREGSLDPNAHIFKRRFSSIIILTTGRASPARLKRLREVADEVKVFGEKEINFQTAFRWLRKKWKIKTVLCEGGGEINGALFRAGVVNELHLTICPKIFGGRGAPTIADGLGAATLAQATEMRLKSWRRLGDEIFLVYTVSKPARKPSIRS
jgi:riboflavin-specific deaminase-like protein